MINTEALRLEKRIKDLLYLTKLDYLDTRERVLEPIDLTWVIQESVERFRWRKPEQEAKGKALVAEIKRSHATGQPVLIGTTSVVESERLSGIFNGGKKRYY